MQYTIEIVKDVTQLRSNTIKRLKQLTQREFKTDDSCGMKYILKRIQERPRDFSCKQAFIARNTSGKIIAWGLLTRNTDPCFSLSDDYEFNVYVAGKYRKMGIGRELFNEACHAIKRKRGKLEFHSWSNQSTNFYRNIVRNASATQRRKFDPCSILAADFRL